MQHSVRRHDKRVHSRVTDASVLVERMRALVGAVGRVENCLHLFDATVEKSESRSSARHFTRGAQREAARPADSASGKSLKSIFQWL